MILDCYTKIDFTHYKVSYQLRNAVILSIINIYDKFKIKETETIAIAVNLFDRCVCIYGDIEDKISLLCVCVVLAIKSNNDSMYDELYLNLAIFFNIHNHKRLVHKELEILKLLDWRVHPIYTINNELQKWQSLYPNILSLPKLDMFTFISLMLFKSYDLEIVAQAILICCEFDIGVINDQTIKDCVTDLKSIYFSLQDCVD
jgi:hypothetical protein